MSYALHVSFYGNPVANAERTHEACQCVTVLLENSLGAKVGLDLDNNAALEALGWAILGAAERLSDATASAAEVRPRRSPAPTTATPPAPPADMPAAPRKPADAGGRPR